MTNGTASAATLSAPASVGDRVPRPSRAAWWAGWIISAIPILWMGVAGPIFLFTMREMVEKTMAEHGYPASTIVPINVVAWCCVLLYGIPQTAVLGAILLTGYLGGAVATHVRAGEPWFLPVIFGVLVWLGLFLRDPRVRCLAPIRKV
jgi:hypothetical protein